MAKLQHLLLSLCLLSVMVGIVLAKNTKFDIVGKVYCDTCRAGFITNLATMIKGAKVRAECRKYENGELTYKTETTTNNEGIYKMEIDNDHQDEVCEVVLVESPMAECNEIQKGRDRAQITVTSNSGISTVARFVNDLSFYKEDPLPACGELLREFNLDDD